MAKTGPSQPALATRNLSKSFGHVQALDDISIDFLPGITGIIGDNGAGKSTLLKILSGAEIADGGAILVDGSSRLIDSARAARAFGIESMYQDLALVDTLSIAENVFLGRELTRGRWVRTVRKRDMVRRASDALVRVKIHLPVATTPVKDLSGGQRQAVAIARALYFGARVLLLDEPTAALGPKETAAFNELVRGVAMDGETVVMIGHNLAHMVALADNLVVMRGGHVVAKMRAADTTLREVTTFMVGGE